MAKQNETTKEQTYTIYTVSGQKFPAKGASVAIDHEKNRVYFLDADGKAKDDWIFILSGIVAIQPSNGKVVWGRYRV
jgi:hypothetical protein